MTFQKPQRHVDRVFVHCSASDVPEHDDISVMRDWHVNGNGWSDVGYHFFIKKDGTRQTGRSLERTPAAQAPHNRGTIAICLHGLQHDKFTSEQFRALNQLCDEIDRAYGDGITYHGHREVAAKACPVFDYREVMNLNRYGERGKRGTTPSDPTSQRPAVADLPIIRRGSRGQPVEYAQELLNIKTDGIFGPMTEHAVEDFQRKHNMEDDGIIGPLTWAKLKE